MITNVAFTIPGDPQGKGRAKIVRIGGFSRMATPAKTVAYEGLVAMAAQQAMKGADPLQCPCVVEIVATFTPPASTSRKHRAEMIAGRMHPAKKPDIDNICKACFDGMNGVVWKDDVQAVQVLLRKRYGETPGVHVMVAAMQTQINHNQLETPCFKP